MAGVVIEDHFDEVMDYDEGSVTARKHGLKCYNPPILSKFLNSPGSTTSKKKQCTIAHQLQNLVLHTPLYSPREHLMSFFHEVGQGVRSGLVCLRSHCGGA